MSAIIYGGGRNVGKTHSARVEAARRASDAKERMDEAQRVLEKAEDEWHRACQELDRIDGSDDYRRAVDAANCMNDNGEIKQMR